MAKKHHLLRTGVPIRKGEGTRISLGPLRPGDRQGEATAAAGLADVAVPDRKYYATICCVETDARSATLMFGQPQIGTNRLRSLLVVRMSVIGVTSLLANIDEMKTPTLDEIARNEGIQPELSPPITVEPVQVVEFASNLSLAAVAGFAACLDFYEASPFSLAHAVTAGEIYVDPVVRVNMPTPFLLGLIARLKDAVLQFRVPTVPTSTGL
jgi:hypothetical protein